MCGRYTIRRADLIRASLRHQPTFGFEEFDEHPRFNIAPSQLAPIVRMTDKGYQLLLARWGLIPAWSKQKPKAQPINARCETVATSGMFRQAFRSRRCLVPADGFYEWQGTKAPKQPFFIRMKSDAPFAFAGLWEHWKPAEGDPIDTYTILTTTPNSLMAPIHNRMPLILGEGDYDRWLSKGDAPADLIRPFDPDQMQAIPVSSLVNSPRNDDPKCIDPI
jgi:putative SOS response-associated peptidase YedK